MTPRSLFLIILKVLGLFFLKDILMAIPQLVSTLLLIFSSDDLGLAAMSMLVTLLTTGAYILVVYYMLFRTGWVVNKLKLDKGFSQEDFPLNMHRSSILSIAVIVIGGLVLANAIPSLLKEIATYISRENYKSRFFTDPDSDFTYLVIYLVEIVIGLLMIGYQRQIVNFIEQKRRSNIVN